jgi:hypothetical protein
MSNPLLINLRNDVANLNPDRANFIRSYFDKTGMKIHLIFSLMDINSQLILNSNLTLNQKFITVQTNFLKHLDKKIESGTTDSEDLDFEVKEVASQELEEAVERVIDDIQVLEKDLNKQKKMISFLKEKRFSDLLQSL